MPCPEASWKMRDASSFGALLSSSGIVGTSPSDGILNEWPLQRRLMISPFHSALALARIWVLRKARLVTPDFPAVPSSHFLPASSNFSVLLAPSTAQQSAISLPGTLACPGTQPIRICAPLSCVPSVILSCDMRPEGLWQSSVFT